jgi:DNA-binding beta-propeller fold protein YncE
MNRFLQPLAALAFAAVALSTPAAPFLNATIKREIPLLVPGVYQKGSPIQAEAGVHPVIFDGLQIWVGNSQTGTLKRYDAVSNVQKGSTINLPAGSNVRALVYDGASVWAFINNDERVFKFNATNGAAQGYVTAGGGGFGDGAAFDGEFVWMVDAAGDLLRITPGSTPSVVRYAGLAPLVGAMAFDGKDMWVNSDGYGTVKFSLGTAPAVLFRDETLGGGWGTNGSAFDGQYMWLIDEPESVVRKMDPATNTVLETIALYPDPHSIAFDGQRMWITCRDSSTIVKVDVATSQIVGTIAIPTGSRPDDIAFDGKYMWVTAEATGVIYKFLAKL